MTGPPAERLLGILGDESARKVVRCLTVGASTQSAVIAETGLAQSAVSKTLKLLSAAGLVTADSARGGTWVLRARDEVLGVFLAADHASQALVDLDRAEQLARTAEDRRLAVRTAKAATRPATEDRPLG